MEKAQNLDVSKVMIPTARYSSSASECGIPNCHVKGTPLFELVSVRITSDTFNEEVDGGSKLPYVEIFGHILLIDDHGNEFSLFNRKRGEAKTVFLDEASDTSVILQNFELYSPRCLPSKFWLEFYLRDRHRDIVIIDDWKFIDCTRVVTYDKKQQIIFDKEQRITPFSSRLQLVYVEYAIFQCALLASVSIVVEDIVEDGSDQSDVVHSGAITASTVMNDMSCIGRVLFDNSEELVFGALTYLSLFAVPAYSLIEIQVNVEVNGDKIVGALKFQANDWSCVPYEQEILGGGGGKCRIRVFVHFGHAKKFLPEYEICEWRDAKRASKESYEDYFSNREDKNIGMFREKKRPRSRNRKKDQLIYIQPRLKALSKLKWNVSEDPNELVEVFSVSICCYDGDDDAVGGLSLSLNGKILAYDNFRELIIFDGDKKHEMLLHSPETIKLVAPGYCYTGSYFGIEVDVKDEGQGLEISNGYASYDFSTVTGWHNRRICSIIRGKHGYAALHYTIFSDAVQAKLKFTLEPNIPSSSSTTTTTDGLEVHGMINVRYSNFRYSTHYEKKYYQSTLFETGESEAVKLVGGCGEMPLSKSVVAVPLNASLIVLANVHVLSGGQHLAALHYKQTFDPEKPLNPKISCDEFRGSDFSLLVSVEWSCVLSV
ncbi:hypothetical protein OROMI_012593 [Orobanche minor]